MRPRHSQKITRVSSLLSIPLTDIVCPPSTGRELTKLKGEDFFERGERALASPPPPPPPPLPDSGRGLRRCELVAVRVQGALYENVL